MKHEFFNLLMTIMKQCFHNEEKIRKEYKLSLAEYHGLMVLEPGEQLLCSEFSQRMGLSPSRGSRIIERMVNKRYVMSQKGKNDRRIMRISLTQRGTQARECIETRMDECEQRLLKNLTRHQQHEMKKNLSILASAMTKEDSYAR